LKLFGLILIAVTAVTTQAQVSLRVRPYAVVSPDTEVRLSQLVDAQGLSPEGQKRLSEIVLSRAPAHGERQEIANAGLTAALRPVLEAERARSVKVQIVIPKSVTIDTIKREISAEMVTGELIQGWQPLCADCKLEIEGLSLPKVDGIKDWTMKMKAELPRGSFSVPVELIKMNGQALPAWISGRLSVKRKVPVAQRLLGAGERLEAKDIAWEYRDTSFSLDGIPDESELEGKKVKQSVRASDVLWRGNLEKEKAIRRGDLVTVRSADGMWEVSMSVVAQQDAYVGDVVNLKHPRNGSSLVGKVTAQGEVDLR
jgi:flagella basal body P-ring formation protein FlgA